MIPYKCKKCEKICETKYGSGMFCSQLCAKSRIWSKDQRKKISDSVKSSKLFLEKNNEACQKRKKPNIEKICLTCQTSFTVPFSKRTSKYCKARCGQNHPGVGGYRVGSGHSKSGWCRGFYCGSTWELAFLIWCTDHGLTLKRCEQQFDYVHDHKIKKYLPDFMIDDLYIEIKGFSDDRVESKLRDFPHQILILRKDDLQPVFDYVKKTYNTNKFVSLYDGYKPKDDKNNACKVCGNPCKNMYCGNRCSMLGNKWRPRSDSNASCAE